MYLTCVGKIKRIYPNFAFASEASEAKFINVPAGKNLSCHSVCVCVCLSVCQQNSSWDTEPILESNSSFSSYGSVDLRICQLFRSDHSISSYGVENPKNGPLTTEILKLSETTALLNRF